jgi:hypothetical protein
MRLDALPTWRVRTRLDNGRRGQEDYLCVASCFWRSDVRGGTGPCRVIVGAELTHPGESA